MRSRRKPDHEAESIVIRADRIDEEGYFPRSNTHGGNRVTAKGDVEIEIRKQHPGAKDKDVRPEPGTILVGKGKETEVTVEARRFGKIDRASKRQVGTASKRVEIFGKLKRWKK